MNKIILIGRLTADPEIRYTANGHAVANFTVAVDRKFKNANGEREADFIRCVAWRHTAEFVDRYFQKGQRIAVEGNLQTRSYVDNATGERRYITEVNVEAVEFADGPPADRRPKQPQRQARRKPAPAPEPPADEFFDDETALPFDL